MALPFSVLDLSPIGPGQDATAALRETIALAQHVESLGATRYWLAEHHNAGSLASSAPEILIGQIGAATKTLRVGSGGMMLPNHAPLKVAELFRVLGALFPGRVDLGLGRAAGTDPRTAAALRGARGPSADDFPVQMKELLAFLDEHEPPRGPFGGGIRAIPSGVAPPEVWVLGSSEYGGAYAAANGLPFAFARHINPRDAEQVLRAYRRDFRPSARCAKPRSIVALSIVCAADDATARDLQASTAFGFLRFTQGLRDLPMPTIAEAKAHRWDDDELALLRSQEGRAIVGTAETVKRELAELVRATEADEVMALAHVP
jgi:luciferase family oxidoreductase group 1